jgi:RAQPRD family integrative conjugative element protein
MRKPWLLLFCLWLPPAVLAQPGDLEREKLDALIHEIDALKPFVDAAKAAAEQGGGRVRFNYRWLANDLELIKSGIRDHLDAPRATPRNFPPLKGDYRW